MRIRCCVALLVAVFTSSVCAQPVIPLGSTPYVERFDSFLGTAETVPTGWVLTGSDMPFRGTLTLGLDTYASAGGWYSYNDTDSPDDRNLGRHAPDGGDGGYDNFMTVKFRNDTGVSATGFEISYRLEQASIDDFFGSSTYMFSDYTTDGATWNSIHIGRAGHGTGGGVLWSDLRDWGGSKPNESISVPIPAGSGFSVRWWLRTGGPSWHSHVGLDDVSVRLIPVPEPGSLAGLALLTLALGRRRSRP